MKKKLLFIILLLIPFVVKADIEVFSPKNRVDNYPKVETLIKYNDKYLALLGSDVTSSAKAKEPTGDYLSYINADGTQGAHVELESYLYDYNQLLYDDNYIYLLTSSDYECLILVFDKNLEYVNDYTIDNFDVYTVTGYGNEFASLKDDYFYLYNDYDKTVIKLKKDFSSSETLEPTDELLKTVLPQYYYFFVLDEEYYNTQSELYSITIQGDYVISLFEDYSKCPKSDNCILEDKVRVYDKELNLIKEVKIEKQTGDRDDSRIYPLHATIIKGYLLVDAVYVESPKEKAASSSTVEGRYYIFDLEGNLLQTIKNNEELSTVFIETSDGFVTDKRGLNVLRTGIGRVNGAIAFYSLTYYPIEATASHGSVAVRASALAGEVITIEVTPQKGYTLSEIIVTDEEGNRLPVTNNSFVMGASKVTVRAFFVPENPNTGNFYVMLICLIAAFSGIFLVTQKKKLDFLK